MRRPRSPIVDVPPPVASPAPPTPPEPGNFVGVDELMIGSLPPLMSGADVYLRQFYRAKQQLPYRRYLPLKGL